MYLERISSPADVKALDASCLPELCAEIRHAILERSAAVGGHVGSNLGAVELTVALHRVFTSPHDKLVFDVSHQTYIHKMLTGRACSFTDPARYDEVSGFSNPAESEHDLFSVGHTSTSVSLACGLAKARDLAGDTGEYDVVAVIGDGSLSGGLAYEGLDNLAELGTGIIVVVNDNGWSIAENHGGIYRSLAELRRTDGASSHNLFRAMGLDYRYVADGNDLAAVTRALEEVRGIDHPVVLHVSTVKGEGYAPAMADPEAWHHPKPFDVETGKSVCSCAAAADRPRTYADLTGSYLLERMADDPSLVAISAATPYVIGFTPERRATAGLQFVDVGIAEEHAVTYTAALASAGARPVLGVYGVFLQRAYDELWHDLCLNAAPATIVVCGCSAFGNNDCTHLGIFDIAVLGTLPNLIYLAPVCVEEYRAMLAWAVGYTGGPVAIRVPERGGMVSRPELAPAADEDFSEPRWLTVREGADVAVLALGDFLELGEQVADELALRFGVRATVVDPRFATQVDEAALDRIAAGHRVVVTLEDGILEGGWGERVARYLAAGDVRVRCYGIAKGFPDRFDPQELLAENGIMVEGIVADIAELLGR